MIFMKNASQDISKNSIISKGYKVMYYSSYFQQIMLFHGAKI